MKLLKPRRYLYKKNHLVKVKNKPSRNLYPLHGDYALLSLSSGKVTPEHFESCRLALKRSLKRKNYYVLRRFFPQCQYTKKSSGVRMGSGKGPLTQWFSPVALYQIFYEFSKQTKKTTFKTFKNMSQKLTFTTKILTKHHLANISSIYRGYK